MHERHINRKKYFNEQVYTTTHFVIPYIEDILEISPQITVAEIGCGEGGNLLPFLDRGCRVVGIDLAANKIKNAIGYYEGHPNNHLATFLSQDIYKVDPADFPPFDLIIMKDTIEHIPDQTVFLENLKKFMAPNGKVFFSFPPWRMPFGGHQQIIRSQFLSKLPYFHLLPNAIYTGLLKGAGEKQTTVNALIEIKETGISIDRFENILKKLDYKIKKKTYFLVNPNYEIKFKLKSKPLPNLINIPYFRDFFTTAVYCLAEP